MTIRLSEQTLTVALLVTRLRHYLVTFTLHHDHRLSPRVDLRRKYVYEQIEGRCHRLVQISFQGRLKRIASPPECDFLIITIELRLIQ